jgi:hypothetical protein
MLWEQQAMQMENWAAIIEVIPCYDDAVLAAAQVMARRMLADEAYDVQVLRTALEADKVEIDDWHRECWQHDGMQEAIALCEEYDSYYAMRTIVSAMLVRSHSWEQSFV